MTNCKVGELAGPSLVDHCIVAVPFPGSWLTTNLPANGFVEWLPPGFVGLRCQRWVFEVTPLQCTMNETVAGTEGPCLRSFIVFPKSVVTRLLTW